MCIFKRKKKKKIRKSSFKKVNKIHPLKNDIKKKILRKMKRAPQQNENNIRLMPKSECVINK